MKRTELKELRRTLLKRSWIGEDVAGAAEDADVEEDAAEDADVEEDAAEDADVEEDADEDAEEDAAGGRSRGRSRS